MSAHEEALKKVLTKLLGNYVPNQADMDNLSSYLYKVVVSVFKDADMKKEYKSIKGITQLDEDGFKKAIKDISLFTSQRVLIETLNKSYRDLKNIVPTVTVEDAASNPQMLKPVKVPTNNSVAEAEFKIDIKSVPKVPKQKKSETVVQEKKMASEFEPDVKINLDEVNKNTNKPNNTSGDDGDLTLGAGILGGEGFSSVPNVDISLDY